MRGTNRLISAIGVVFTMGLALACSAAAPAPAQSVTPTLATPAVSVKLEVGVGAPPATGWKWAVADFDIAADARTEGPHEHDFAWVFYAIKGSADVTVAGASKGISAG